MNAHTSIPIVAAVDASAASRAAVEEAVILAAELQAPLVFVYVRSPSRLLGAPFYQRRLSAELQRARRVLRRALRIARVAEVEAEAEILAWAIARSADRPVVVAAPQPSRLALA
jgi:nucleotide-binding universal stress UspA family protein